MRPKNLPKLIYQWLQLVNFSEQDGNLPVIVIKDLLMCETVKQIKLKHNLPSLYSGKN